MAPFFCCAAASGNDWTAADRTYVLRLVRRKLTPAMVKTDLGPTPARLVRPLEEGVFVSLFWKGRRYAHVGGSGSTLLAAITDAAERMSARCRRLPWSRTALKAGRLKVDVVTLREPFRPLSTRRLFAQLSIGLDGLAVRTPERPYVFVPLMVLRHGSRVEPVSTLFSEVGYPAPNLLADNVRLERLRTTAFVESAPGGEGLALYRGNVLIPPVDSRAITRSFLMAGAWLLSVQRPDGSFLYEYDPMTLRATKDYNMVRHAAVSIPLYMLYEVTKDRRFLQAGDRCVEYAKKFLKQSAAPLPYAHILYRSKSPLGTAAVLLQGLARRATATGEVGDTGLMKRLGNFIRLLTTPEGRVYRNLQQAVERRLPAIPPRYYPGEAMLALALLHKHAPADAWLSCARRIAAFQSGQFVRGEPPDHWVIMGLAELYRLTGEQSYADQCLRMADVFCSEQILPGKTEHPDFVGGFTGGDLPSVCTAATRIEAINAAFEIALLTGRPHKKYGDVILRSARFHIQQQYRPENTFFVEEPDRVMGMYRCDPVRMSVRLDFAQHGIASLLGASFVARLREAPPKTPAAEKAP